MGGAQRIIGGSKFAADGEAGLKPIGRDRGAAAVFGVIAPTDRIDQDPDAGGLRRFAQGLQEIGRADSLVVIAHQHNCTVDNLRLNLLDDAALDGGFECIATFVIDTEDLLWVLLLSAADVAFFHF